MTQITTSGGMITFQDTVTGLAKQIGQNQLWLMFKADTVNFLQVTVPTDGYDGTPFWSCRAANLEINGETYTIEELKSGEGLSDLFSTMGWGYEIVEELPESGEAGVIYLVYDEETGTYTEYLWLSQEQAWEVLGSVGDIDLGNYYNKTQIDTMLQGYATTSSLASVATSGSYTDLSNTPSIPAAQIQSDWNQSDNTSLDYIKNKPTIPAAQVNANWNETNQSSKAFILNKPTIPAAQVQSNWNESDTNSKAYIQNKPDLSTKQDTLVSGTNIKTINNQSLLGSGNIDISAGSGTQVQSDWNEADQSSMAYIQNKPTNVSAFTNDAGYLTQHQSLADVFADVLYDSQTKHINFYGKGDTQHTTVLAYVDATDFVVDGMVSNVEVKSVTISGTPTTCLVITFNSDAGKQDINIPISQIFDASNYYTKSEVDTALSGKASTNSLATVATTGAYSDLTGTPTIPAAQVNSDWNAVSGVAQILNKPDLSNYATSSDVEIAIESLMGGGWSHTYEYPESDLGLTVYESYPGTYYDSYSEKYLYFIPTAMTVIQDDEMAVSGGAVYNALQGKQDTLTAGTNITIATDQQTGNLVISATGGGSAQVQSDWNQSDSTAVDYIKNKPTIPSAITVDSALDSTSTNPVENRVIYAALGDVEQALAIINGTQSA